MRIGSSVYEVRGDGDGLGWNASALYRRGRLSLGAAYHSASTTEIKGDYELLETLPSGSGSVNGEPVTLASMPASQAAKLYFNLPWRLQVGLRYQFTGNLAAEFDWTRTGWGDFDKLEVKSRDSGETLFSETFRWRDSDTYHLGFTYDVLSNTQLRAGYAFDQTGQTADHFSARVADSDRHLLSFGIGQNLRWDWKVDLAYRYLKFKNRDHRGNTAYNRVVDFGEDTSGTDAFDGKYRADGHLFALEVHKTF